jgi:hypothetical protein
MFDKTNFEELGKDIYVYKNFISEKECQAIVRASESFLESDWYPADINIGNKGSLLLNKQIKELKPIQNRLSKILNDGIYLGKSLQITKMIKGSYWHFHSDNPSSLKIREANKILKNKDKIKLVPNQIFGIVMYFNDFEGGSLIYPNQNYSYNPSMGDLLIHSAEEHCFHGVSELKSNIRYSHSNNLFNYLEVPEDLNGF